MKSGSLRMETRGPLAYSEGKEEGAVVYVKSCLSKNKMK